MTVLKYRVCGLPPAQKGDTNLQYPTTAQPQEDVPLSGHKVRLDASSPHVETRCFALKVPL